VATTRLSVATLTQSFNIQATPPRMSAVAAMVIHNLESDTKDSPLR
jgi:hypothetical protein